MQLDRQYRFAARKAYSIGFEIGETSILSPVALQISFMVNKAGIDPCGERGLKRNEILA